MGLASARGRAGEALAAAYLELRGYTIVGRNLRLGGVEVDLVARDGPVDVIVEVKFRGRADYGGAAAAVDRNKQQRLHQAARAIFQGGARRVRIDVVAVELTPEGARLGHYLNAVTG